MSAYSSTVRARCSATSARVRRTAEGVRSSCDASATNRRIRSIERSTGTSDLRASAAPPTATRTSAPRAARRKDAISAGYCSSTSTALATARAAYVRPPATMRRAYTRRLASRPVSGRPHASPSFSAARARGAREGGGVAGPSERPSSSNTKSSLPGMRSSSRASTAWPLSPRSCSRISMARSISCVAATSCASRTRPICCVTATYTAVPKKRRIVAKMPTYHAVRRRRIPRKASVTRRSGSPRRGRCG